MSLQVHCGIIMKTIFVLFCFAICALATSPPKCSPPNCPADCGIENIPGGCPQCKCLLEGKTTPGIQCSPPKCAPDCTIQNSADSGCPVCVCSKGRKTTPSLGEIAAKCPPPNCPDNCGIANDPTGCPICACPRNKNVTQSKGSKCPDYTCPGECPVGFDPASNCQTCLCGPGAKLGNGMDRQLGEPCLSTTDCAAAYSTCKTNICTCIDGFTSDKGLCTVKTLQCPTWKGQSKSPTPGKACEHIFNQTTGKESHTCTGSIDFCFIHPKEKTDSGNDVGHCCPSPPPGSSGVTIVCPYSVTHNGTCPDMSQFPADAPIPESKQRTCSYITSDCIHQFNQGICCPLPCTASSSLFSVNGKCFDYVQIGEVCETNAQCIGGSQCMHQGSGKPLCRCPKKTCYEPSQHCC